MTRFPRVTARKLAPLAGFVTQLQMIVFVSAIGLQQLELTTAKLNQVVDVHMRKLTLTRNMVIDARERKSAGTGRRHVSTTAQRLARRLRHRTAGPAIARLAPALAHRLEHGHRQCCRGIQRLDSARHRDVGTPCRRGA